MKAIVIHLNSYASGGTFKIYIWSASFSNTLFAIEVNNSWIRAVSFFEYMEKTCAIFWFLGDCSIFQWLLAKLMIFNIGAHTYITTFFQYPGNPGEKYNY